MNIIPEHLSETSHSHHVQHVKEGEHRKMEFTNLTEDEKIVVQSLLDLQCTGSQGLVNSFKDNEVQVTSGDLIISFSSTIITNAQLNSLTGIPNFEMLENLTKLISEFYPDIKKHKLTVKDRIIIVFMKLKMAVKFTIISFLFRVSQSTIKNIFSEYISYLANVLKSCIPWPSFCRNIK